MTSRRLSRRRRWLFRLGAVLVALLPFVLAELILRLLGVGYDTHLIVPVPGAAEPTLFRFNPDADRAYYGAEDLWGPDPRPFLIPKPGDTYRIVVVGGSTVAGFPYPFGLALPKQLEVVLQCQYPERKFEVLNAGMIAIMSTSEVDVVRQALRCQPDLIVVHSGHNEFYGPGGAASKFRSLAPGLYPLTQFLKRQRLFQLPVSLLHGRTRGQLIEKLPADVGIPLDSPLFEETRQRFKNNLTLMTEIVRRSGASILISTVPSNLRDLAPLQPHRDPAAAGSLKEADTRISYQEYEAALSALAAARQAAPSDPLVAYRSAQCLEALGRRQEAAEAYALACDLDGCRLRAARPLLDAVREVAATTQIPFCDVDGELKSRSRWAAPGSDLFLEHVHFTADGNWQAASILGKFIVEAIFKDAWRPERHPDDGRRDELLGLTTLDRLAADSLTLAVFDAWPFNLSAGREREIGILKDRIATSFRSLEPLEQQLFSSLDMNAMQGFLWHAMGTSLLAAGKPDRALAAFERHIGRQPWDPLGYEGAAQALEAQGRRDAAQAMRQRAPSR